MLPTQRQDEFCLLTVQQVAECLCCSEKNVYKLIAKGKLPLVRIGLEKGYRVDSRDLDAFVSGRKFRYQPEAIPMPKATLKHLRA